MESVDAPDETARREAVDRLASTQLPAAALGRLGDLGAWYASCHGSAAPPRRARVVLFAADHGIAAAGVSAHEPGETAARVRAVRRGGAPVSLLADTAGAGVRLVDVGLAAPDGDGDGDAVRPEDARSVRAGSGRIDREDAMTADETAAAVQVGRDVADSEVDAGADVLVPAAVAVGISTPTAVLAAAMTGREPVAVVGRGSGIDDEAWMRKTAAVRDALRRTRAVGRDPVELLRVAGGPDLAAITGFLAQAARRRTPVLLDGAPVAVAALLADATTAGAAGWWAAATRDTEPAQALALDILGLDPLLLLEMRAGQGTGAVAALPLLTMATRVLAELPAR